MNEEILTFGPTEIILYWNEDKTYAGIRSIRYSGTLQLCTGGTYSVYLRRGANIGRGKSYQLKDAILAAMKEASQSRKLSDQLRFI